MNHRARWPSTLREVAEVLESLFLRRGRDRIQAAEDANAVASELASHFGGRQFYLPMNLAQKVAKRASEIASEANGRNTQELAERFGITERSVQRIVSREQSRRRTP